ncbi:MarR family winged helix-turn-helix transcriptional regulator [Chelatococcus reniformis]|uniref:Transcriptional regulator n=1 Tax=Chelatococcus reniformis TaxID=1494448 RepID=A0A916UCE4_9HYPH|nr:MarR family winged helix-turn-helix transcriptional regulator [Chelatococcus reniformis]GGC65916.1 transcriptional regulator [Chelatococcus reniformis]
MHDPFPGDDERPASTEATGPLVLQDYMPYRLAVLSEAVSQGLARHYARRFGIAIPEWRVLAVLGEFKRMTGKAIGQHTRMHKTKVSRAVSALEKRGLIVGEVSPNDRREINLSLTDEGYTVYQQIIPVALGYQEKVVGGLADTDIAALNRVIDAIFDRVDEPD